MCSLPDNQVAFFVNVHLQRYYTMNWHYINSDKCPVHPLSIVLITYDYNGTTYNSGGQADSIEWQYVTKYCVTIEYKE